MGNAILYRAPFGVPGALTRASQATVEAWALDASLPFPAFGLPVKIVAGLAVPAMGVGDVAPYGWLVRPYPTTGKNAIDPLGSGVPLVSGVANVMVRGYMSVKCSNGVAIAGAPAFLRYANGGTYPIGGVEAAAVGSETVALTNAFFMGPADADGNVEIAFNI